MTVKDTVITTLRPKITGDGEVLIREGDGITSIDPATLLAGATPSVIQNTANTARLKVNTDDTSNLVASKLEIKRNDASAGGVTLNTSGNDNYLAIEVGDFSLYDGWITVEVAGAEGAVGVGGNLNVTRNIGISTGAAMNPAAYLGSNASGRVILSGAAYNGGGVPQIAMVEGDPLSSPDASSAVMTALDTGIVETNADIETTLIGKGIIMKSPDGSRWKVTIDDVGLLTSVKV